MSIGYFLTENDIVDPENLLKHFRRKDFGELLSISIQPYVLDPCFVFVNPIRDPGKSTSTGDNAFVKFSNEIEMNLFTKKLLNSLLNKDIEVVLENARFSVLG